VIKMYKVVREEGEGKYFSARIMKGPCCMEYKVGEFVQAPINGSLVFESSFRAHSFIKEQAYSFPKTCGKLRLFVAECEEEIDLLSKEVRSIWASELYYSEDITLEEILNQIKQDVGMGWPLGTRMFKKVKLLKEI